MKNFIVILLLLLVGAGVIFVGYKLYKRNGRVAYDNSLSSANNVPNYTTKTTGANSDGYHTNIPMSQFTCAALITGTTPTAVVVSVDGSIDGSNWFALATTSSLTASTMFHISSKPVYFIRGNLVTRSTSSTDTAIEMPCIGIQ